MISKCRHRDPSPKTKPILVGIIYNPPNQSEFLDKLSTALSETELCDNQEIYLLGDLNINLIKHGRYLLEGNKLVHHITSGIVKKLFEFCTSHGLTQMITLPTRISENTSSTTRLTYSPTRRKRFLKMG